MHWVLQENIFREEAFDRLVETLERFNIPYSLHKVVPFVGALIPVNAQIVSNIEAYADPALSVLKNPVICMGSYSMRHAAKKYGWSPGVFDLMETGSFERCMEHWGSYMLNSDSVVCAFKDAHWLEGERFIRPCDDSKYFAGKLIEADEFNEWRNNVCVLKLDYGNSLTPETPIQVAKPKKIYTEFRCWIVRGEVITMSLYKRGNTVLYENMDNDLGNEARTFVDSVLRTSNNQPNICTSLGSGWRPAEAFCLDVCQTDQGWKIVEINTLNSCGFYAADLTKLVLALEHGFNIRRMI